MVTTGFCLVVILVLNDCYVCYSMQPNIHQSFDQHELKKVFGVDRHEQGLVEDSFYAENCLMSQQNDIKLLDMLLEEIFCRSFLFMEHRHRILFASDVIGAWGNDDSHTCSYEKPDMHVDLGEKVPIYDILSLNWRRKKRSTEEKLSFEAWNEKFLVSTDTRVNLLSDDLISVVRRDNQSRLLTGLPSTIDFQCHFQGKLLSHDNASVSISLCSHTYALIMMPDHFIVIHPIPNRHKTREADHVIFKRSPGLIPNMEFLEDNIGTVNRRNQILRDDQSSEFCEVIANKTENDNKLRDDVRISESIDAEAWSHFFDGRRPNRPDGQVPDVLNLELALFIDARLWSYFVSEFGEKRAEQEIVDFSLALINNVYLLYQEKSINPRVEIHIVRYEIWKTQPSNLDAKVHRNGEAQLFLDSFCSFQSRLNSLDDDDVSHWDHATLLTGFDLYHSTPSVAGVAPVARMCDHLFSCSLVEGMHLGRSFVLAHEMGHNFGMVHDGVQNQCGKGCCLMSAINGAGKTTWSKCSGEELRDYVTSLGKINSPPNCLVDEVHKEKVVQDYKRNSTYPGQRFSIDQQCSFFWGRGYKSETPVGKDKSELCYMLWCSNGGSTISTAHPALEGSWCGDQKWCIEGKCVDWTTDVKKPTAVDGGWSSWSDGSISSKSVCSRCKIRGSLSVKRETRSCDKPAPNNGGRNCPGSAIRGLICSGPVVCESADHEQYADLICQNLRTDAERPDPELSGKSFQHPISKCKIWCHLGGTQLVRNKGFYPDGTSCEDDKYCVNGECLSISCGEQALVFNSNECPGATREDDVAKWSSWTSWSGCSQTCGDLSIQERRRTCLLVPCQGQAIETKKCIDLPKCDSQWSFWSEWSTCSTPCGAGGTVLRRRSCTIGFKCPGLSEETAACSSNPSCSKSWTNWESWSPCSKSCGPGTRERHRRCSSGQDCDGVSSEVQPCNSRTCEALDSPWGEWSPCSQTCGEAVKKRVRRCTSRDGQQCKDLLTEEQRCPKQRPCPDDNGWSEWSSWAPCSASCGSGRRSRSRSCENGQCDGPTIESSPCLIKLCSRIQAGEWKQWSEWDRCSTSCGFQRSRSRSRQCSTFACDGGNSTEFEKCPDVRCPESSDGDFGTWDQWELWSECSKSCGGGVRQRIRYCYSDRCPPGNGIETQSCNPHPCSRGHWSQWSRWQFCSSIKKCRDKIIMSERTRRCWATDRKQCWGFTKERRPCKPEDYNACQKLLPEMKPIQSLKRPEWSTWSQWSACNCDSRRRIRRRMCQIFEPKLMGFCIGPVFEEQTCQANICESVKGQWSDWSQWSACSSECSSRSYRLRNRLCADPQPSNRGSYCSGPSFERQDCSWLNGCSNGPINGNWSNWTSWSECSSKCNGQRTRSRFCDNPPASQNGDLCSGPDFDFEQCANGPECR